jgi:hypothetical protein
VLGVTGSKVGDDLVDNCPEVVGGLLVAESQIVLFTDIVGEVAHIAMPPFREIRIGALQSIEQTASLALLPKYHR